VLLFVPRFSARHVRYKWHPDAGERGSGLPGCPPSPLIIAQDSLICVVGAVPKSVTQSKRMPSYIPGL